MLATAVRRPAGAKRAGPWVPAEPGSTIKPFAAAGLLQLGKARAADSVYGENGVYRVPKRSRPIRDDHPHAGWLTLAKAIEVSSNVGMVKFTQRLRPEEHYELLRDFGFGTPTGIEVAGESPGLVRILTVCLSRRKSRASGTAAWADLPPVTWIPWPR